MLRLINVIDFVLLQLVSHLLLQLTDVLFSNVADCNLVETVHRNLLCALVNQLQVFFRHWHRFLKSFVELPIKLFVGVLAGPKTLIFANIGP